MSEKLQKVLATLGLGSRRELEKYIEAGRVSVDGKVATLGDSVEGHEVIRVDGNIVKTAVEVRDRLKMAGYNVTLVNAGDPNDKTLYYTTTNKEGYRQYKSEARDCENCPFKSQCTKSKVKTITRHIWENFVEQANELRYTEEWKEIYPLRKQSIERVFADCKENFGLRFKRLKELKKNQQQGLMIFACHNLKKMALWNWK